MFPINDENPTLRTPWMTILLLVAIWASWIFLQAAGSSVETLAASICNWGMVPGELTRMAPLGSGVPLGRGMACLIDDEPRNWATPVISMFLHGSWTHIIGNSLYLWVFGNNVEDSMGRGRFLAFYLLTGVIAGLAHVAIGPTSPVPTVGASGAISGVMGAYLVLYPSVRVRTFIPPFFFIRFPAWVVLIFWFGGQLLTGLPQLSMLRRDLSGGVAVWAHIGGFLAGALLVRWFVNPAFVQRRSAGGDAKAVWS